MKNKENIKSSLNWNAFLSYFIIIDILFFPYFKYFVIPYSLVIVFLWTLRNYSKLKVGLDFKLFIFISFFVLLSTFLSYFYTPHFINGYDIWGDNLKRPIQLLSSFLYYFYFTTKLKCVFIPIKNILLVFILFVDALAIITIFDVAMYFDIKNLFSVRDPFVDYYYATTNDYFFRYSYLWVDPNNAAYILVSVCIFLVFNEKLNSLTRLFIFLSIGLILITCMSTGAFLAMAIVMLFSLFSAMRNIKFNITFRKKDLFILLFSVFIIFILLLNINSLLNFDMFNYSLNRVTENNPESRESVYDDLLKTELIKNVVIGDGYTLTKDGQIRRPHSDHFRIIYGYGFLAYFSLLLLLFRKRKGSKFSKHIFIIPAFICFSINSIVDEQKIFIIYLILLAYLESSNIKESKI
ncbi:hypothetical protein [Metabacillus sp. FJAT-52054]|uniref:O-antigen ligase family protein n=1 Tax=Metabacillus sediminis TaxID=3117746 RepID=A0ABZ2NG03_9BACI